MNDLEELAHHSAASARASVADLPIPPTPGHSISRPWLRAGVVVTAGLAAIVGLIHFSADGAAPADVAGGPDTTQSGPSPADSIPYFEFADIPDGWILSVSDDPNHPTGSLLTNAAMAYGAGPAEDPFSGADLLVSLVELPPSADLGLGADSEILVRGRHAYDFERSGDFKSVSWLERSGLLISLQSRRYGVDDLVRIADNLSVDGLEVTLSNPPDGMSLISSVVADAPFPWSMTIADPESDSRLILQALTRGTGLLELAGYTRAATVDATVRGTAGVLVPMGPDPAPHLVESVSWIENGQAMSLIAVGSGDPVAIANSLRRIDRARFEELLAANPAPNTPTTMPPYTATGSDPEGPPGAVVTIAVP